MLDLCCQASADEIGNFALAVGVIVSPIHAAYIGALHS